MSNTVITDKEKELLDAYLEWAKTIDNEFITGNYSNPYYVSIPKGWDNATNRIMVVGEEGYGEWGCGKKYGWRGDEVPWDCKVEEGIKNIQKYNEIVVSSQRMFQKDDMNNPFWDKYVNDYGFAHAEPHDSAFWRRFRKLYNYDDTLCVWNNLDKIHSTINRKCLHYQLNLKEETTLHKNTILAREIEILRPTLVIFFGWYKNSIKLELPNVSKKLESRRAEWKESKICEGIDYEAKNGQKIPLLFIYHPNYLSKKNEIMVLNAIDSAIKKK